MPKRNLRIIKPDFPMTGACDSCQTVFISRNENPKQAEEEIRSKFDAHACTKQDAS